MLSDFWKGFIVRHDHEQVEKSLNVDHLDNESIHSL